MRCDIAVFDVPASTVRKSDADAVAKHALLLGEIKRDSKGAKKAQKHQVEPLLKFADKPNCIAIYWDDSDRRFYWRDPAQSALQSAGIAQLPRWGWGANVQVAPLTYGDLAPSKDLVGLLDRIENTLHQGFAHDRERRYHLIFQILLTKLYDEHAGQASSTKELGVQDYDALEIDQAAGHKQFNAVVTKAINHYGPHLPIEIEKELPEDLNSATLYGVLKLLAPVLITGSSQEVVQAFYMKLAPALYRHEMAQYWTPVPLTEFIVRLLNPQPMEHVRDPACGGADFLTSAYRQNGLKTPNYAGNVWGSDFDAKSCQVAVLNMMLNGDGKSNIHCEDSLEVCALEPHRYDNHSDVMICNPPFGTKIVETRNEILEQFALGHEWRRDEHGEWRQSDGVREKTEIGLLFLELCVRQAIPGGRVGIILPNGYLGNLSPHYQAAREWLLRTCRVAAIVGLPGNAFQTSGAGVMASVVVLEKREEPLERAENDRSYKVFVGLLNNVGWNLRSKRGEPVYERDPKTGAVVFGEDGEKTLRSDFDAVLAAARSSDAANDFPWLTEGTKASAGKPGWSVPVGDILDNDDRPLDPKRLAARYRKLIPAISRNDHFRLGDVADFIDPGRRSELDAKRSYRYADISSIQNGVVEAEEMRGWALPDRARHRATKGDLFLGAIWSSVGKWCLAGEGCEDLVVTNGCLRLRLKPEHLRIDAAGRVDDDSLLIDLAALVPLELFAVQMRAMARGSDGLAAISATDAQDIVLPRITDPVIRQELKPFVQNLLDGYESLSARVKALIADKELRVPEPEPRREHTSLL